MSVRSIHSVGPERASAIIAARSRGQRPAAGAASRTFATADAESIIERAAEIFRATQEDALFTALYPAAAAPAAVPAPKPVPTADDVLYASLFPGDA